jgi:hypothetical protein
LKEPYNTGSQGRDSLLRASHARPLMLRDSLRLAFRSYLAFTGRSLFDVSRANTGFRRENFELEQVSALKKRELVRA